MAQVSEKIFHELQPKYVFGKPINGQAFINLAKNYVDSINSGSGFKIFQFLNLFLKNLFLKFLQFKMLGESILNIPFLKKKKLN